MFFCICSSRLLITKAKDQLLACFRSGIWQVVVPLSECSLDTAPSGKLYTIEIDSKLTFVLEALQQSVEKLFEGRVHNVAFWAEQMSRTVLKLSGILVDTCRVAVGSHPRENEIKEALLSPFLSSVGHSASMLPGSNDIEFSTHFFIEQAVKARGVPGRRPEIDYVIHGEDMKGNILYAIPTVA